MTALTFSEKLCLAIGVAYRLIAMPGTSLADELADAGHPELEADEDFMHLVGERAFWCPDCEDWCDANQRMEDSDICYSCADDFYEGGD